MQWFVSSRWYQGLSFLEVSTHPVSEALLTTTASLLKGELDMQGFFGEMGSVQCPLQQDWGTISITSILATLASILVLFQLGHPEGIIHKSFEFCIHTHCCYSDYVIGLQSGFFLKVSYPIYTQGFFHPFKDEGFKGWTSILLPIPKSPCEGVMNCFLVLL